MLRHAADKQNTCKNVMWIASVAYAKVRYIVLNFTR